MASPAPSNFTAFPFYQDPALPRTSVSQMLRRKPQLSIIVISDAEARALRDGRNELLGKRTILRLDSKRSVVVYSDIASDWNTVAAVARVRVSHEVLPIMDWAPPSTPKKCVIWYTKVFLLLGAVALVYVLIYKAVMHVISLMIGIMPFINAPADTMQGRLQAGLSSQIAGVYRKVSRLARVQIQYVLKAIIAWLEGANETSVPSEVQKATIKQ